MVAVGGTMARDIPGKQPDTTTIRTGTENRVLQSSRPERLARRPSHGHVTSTPAPHAMTPRQLSLKARKLEPTLAPLSELWRSSAIYQQRAVPLFIVRRGRRNIVNFNTTLGNGLRLQLAFLPALSPDLTDPNTIPTEKHDPIYEPKEHLTQHQAQAVIQEGVANLTKVLEANDGSSTCTRCQNALVAAQLAPSLVPETMISLCKSAQFASNTSCEESFNATNFGAILTTVLYFTDVQGLDQYICHAFGSFCPERVTSPLDTSNLFPKPKPENVTFPEPAESESRSCICRQTLQGLMQLAGFMAWSLSASPMLKPGLRALHAAIGSNSQKKLDEEVDADAAIKFELSWFAAHAAKLKGVHIIKHRVDADPGEPPFLL
ncbi:hypothetical protein F5887DRAFT_1283187 [Amanita rubescens]|nr:hypothetical protein F5887DRAFT_1283187 [Amanita rubescens]